MRLTLLWLAWLASACAVAAQPVVLTPLGLIDAAIAEGRFAAAEEILRRAPLAADDPELLLRQAELSLAAGRNGEAMAGFMALVDMPRAAARAWTGLAFVRLRRADESGAAEALEKALALDPALPRVHLGRAILADRRKAWPLAEAAYAKALAALSDTAAPSATDPVHALASANRGWSRLLRGRHAEAEADLAQALAKLPQTAPARARILNNLRLARALQGRYQHAFTDSRQDTLAQDLNMVGFAAMARGDDDVAAAYFRRALELNPRHDKRAAANLEWLQTHTARR